MAIYFYEQFGAHVGPVSEEQLQTLATMRVIVPATMLQVEGEDWVAAQNVSWLRFPVAEIVDARKAYTRYSSDPNFVDSAPIRRLVKRPRDPSPIASLVAGILANLVVVRAMFVARLDPDGEGATSIAVLIFAVVLVGIMAIGFGVIGLREVARRKKPRGEGMAKAGITLGLISLAALVVLAIMP